MVEQGETQAADTGIPATAKTIDKAIDLMQDVTGEFLDTASVNRVYGEPIREGETTIIPTAEIITVMGFGVGGGSGTGEEGQAKGDGVGGGGGGRTLSRPVAIILASPSGVRVEPIVDASKVAIAAVTAFGFILGMLLRMLSPKETMRQLKGE